MIFCFTCQRELAHRDKNTVLIEYHRNEKQVPITRCLFVGFVLSLGHVYGRPRLQFSHSLFCLFSFQNSVAQLPLEELDRIQEYLQSSGLAQR